MLSDYSLKKLESDNIIFNNKLILTYFKNIHPNYITLVGFISNFGILYYFDNRKDLSLFFVIIRLISDILDGNVARKFKKESKLGGLFDTITDLFYNSVLIFIILRCKNKTDINKSIEIICVFVMISVIFLIIKDSLFFHKNLKKKPENLFDLIIFILVNNTLLINFFIIYSNYDVLKECKQILK